MSAVAVNGNPSYMTPIWCIWRRFNVGLAATEQELAGKASRFLKAELKRAGVTYGELARRLETHGLKETEDSISAKLARGTFAATFFLATLAALDKEAIRLEDL
jgi:hypothetical protein